MFLSIGMLKQKYFLTDIFILSAEKQPIKLSWRKIECLLKRKHNMLSAGAEHVSSIIIVYHTVVWLFSCGLWGFSIRYLPAVLLIKG